MTRPTASASAATGWRALWRRRPSRCSPRLWATVILLDRLPWPWGEEILAGIYVIKSLGRGGRLERAHAWAKAQVVGRSARWRLALRLCACYGRFVARLMLLGFRDPAHLAAQVVLRGQEHLEAASGRGVILLGFHLGPPGAAIALRALGHSLTWARGWGDSQGGLRDAWRRFHAAGEMLSLSKERSALGGVLYDARKILMEGGSVYITGDGGRGREAFRIDVPARPIVIRSGWLALCRHTGAQVLPVLTHLEGHRQVVTIYPPLPPMRPDPAGGLEACREALRQILEPFVREHPEQCYSLVFRRRRKRGETRRKRPTRPPGSRTAASPTRPKPEAGPAAPS